MCLLEYISRNVFISEIDLTSIVFLAFWRYELVRNSESSLLNLKYGKIDQCVSILDNYNLY